MNTNNLTQDPALFWALDNFQDALQLLDNHFNGRSNAFVAPRIEGMIRSLRKASSSLDPQIMHAALSGYSGRLSGPDGDTQALSQICSLIVVYTEGQAQVASNFLSNLILSIGYSESKVDATDFRQEEYADTVGAIIKYALARNGKGLELLVQNLVDSPDATLLDDMALAIGHRYGNFGQDFEMSICPKSRVARLLMADQKARWLRAYDQFKILEERVVAKHEEIHALCQLLWDEIVTSARRDVRPGGHDSFTIDELDSSRKIYYRFIREGVDFPTVAIATVEEFSCGARYEHSGFFNYESALDGVYDVLDPDWDGARNLYLVCATLLAYHHILCREVDSRDSSEPREDKADRVSSSGKVVPVRPHLRLLQSGQTPGQSALELAAQVLKRPLPEGYTFVKQHSALRGTQSGNTSETVRGASFNVNLSSVLSWLE